MVKFTLSQSTVLYKKSDYSIIFAQPNDVGFDIIYSSAMLPEGDQSLYGSLLVEGDWLTPEFKKKYVVTSPTTIQEIPIIEYSLLKEYSLMKNVIQLRWQTISGATSYKIYKSTDGTNFSLIYSIVSNLYNESQTTNGMFYYKVGAVIGSNEYLSQPISIVYTLMIPPKPIITPIVIQNEGQTIVKNRITWNAPVYVNNVEIERTDQATSETSYFVTSESGEFEDVGVEVDKTYAYKIRYNEILTGNKSDWSDSESANSLPSNYVIKQPTGLVATSYFSTVTLRCNVATDNFRGGYQWRYALSTITNPDATSGVITLSGNTNSNSFQGEIGKTYNVWVRTYANLGTGIKYSAWATTSVTIGSYNTEDYKIFKQAIVTPAHLSNAFQSGEVQFGDKISINNSEILIKNNGTTSWKITNQLLDNRGYPIIDSNGEMTDRTLAQGFVLINPQTINHPGDIVLQNVTIQVSDNRIVFLEITPFDETQMIKSSIYTRSTEGHIIEKNGYFKLTDGTKKYYLTQGSYSVSQVGVSCNYTEVTNNGLTFTTYGFPYRWQIKEAKVNTTVYPSSIPIINT
jgi:hypothetical protein